MIDRRHSRRLIVKDFQWRFVLVNLFFLTVATLGFVIVLFGPMVVALLDSSVPFEEQALIASTFLGLHGRVWLALILVLLSGLIHLTIVSHRVAGPLVRINRIVRAAGAGDVSMRVKVRAKDYLQEEAASLDRMMLGLRRRIGASRARADRLDAALRDLRSAVSREPDITVQRALLTVEEQASRLHRHLATFRTVPHAPADAGGDTHTARPDTPKQPVARRA